MNHERSDAMVTQYLIFTPQYYTEKPLLRRERHSGALDFSSYICASSLMEAARGILHCLVITAVAYSIDSLNTEPSRVFLFVVALITVCLSFSFFLLILIRTD